MKTYKFDEKVIYNGQIATIFNYNKRGGFYTLLLENGSMIFHVNPIELGGGAQ